MQIVNTGGDSAEENKAYTIILSGQPVQVTLAYDALEMLLTMSVQKKIVDKNKGKIELM